MRLVYSAEFTEVEDAGKQIMDAIKSADTYAGVAPLGGVLLFNDSWHVDTLESEGAQEAHIQLGIDLKMMARDLGMFFYQPLAKLKPDAVPDAIRGVANRYGIEGNYLLLQQGWRFVDHVNTNAIEDFLLKESKANYVFLPWDLPAEPTPEIKDGEHDPEFAVYSSEPEFKTPYFGRKIESFGKLEGGLFNWTNGGFYRPVVEKV